MPQQQTNIPLSYPELAKHVAVVVTSIAAPNQVLRKIASDSIERSLKFLVIGDAKSPDTFVLPGCDFYSLDQQRKLGFETCRLSPVRHYARKNIGYLLAMGQGASIIIETDDDNLPHSEFYLPLDPHQTLPVLHDAGWVNLYRYYSDALIWPRGMPLDAVNLPLLELAELQTSDAYCPIQQGLADENPDVDAIYRLLLPLPVNFRANKLRLALGANAWCPFNSQNTVFFADVFPLLYLPAYCSFRMTDIWRSFVAQKICWINNWSILFREATVVQFRNDHNLMKDFEDEVPGYLNNRRIGAALSALSLKQGVQHIGSNMRQCYDALVGLGVVGPEELPLLEAWLADLSALAHEKLQE